jgi:ubiquitin C-terminal hydrolase
MSLGVKSKKLKPAKLEAQTTNSNTDVVEGRSYSRAGATNNYVNLAGMSNVSNTCYANAVVQALRFCPGFRDGLNHACNRSGDVHPSLSMSLSELFQFMEEADSDTKVVVPSSFMGTLESTFPQFTYGEQHDAQELLKCLLTSLKDHAGGKNDSKAEVLENGNATKAEREQLILQSQPKRVQQQGLAQQHSGVQDESKSQDMWVATTEHVKQQQLDASQEMGLTKQLDEPDGREQAPPVPEKQKEDQMHMHRQMGVPQHVSIPGCHNSDQNLSIGYKQERQELLHLPDEREDNRQRSVSPNMDTYSQTSLSTPPMILSPPPHRTQHTHSLSPLHPSTGPPPDLYQPSTQDITPNLNQSNAQIDPPLTTPQRPVISFPKPSYVSTKGEISQPSGPLSPPEITERSSSLSGHVHGHVGRPKLLGGKTKKQAKVVSNSKQELVVRIQRKNLKMQFPSKKRRKRPRKSRYAKKKSTTPKKKLKATESNSQFLTITSNTRAPLMVRIPLRLLRGHSAAKPHLDGLQRVLRHLPLSPKTPTFDRCFRASAYSSDSNIPSSSDFITELFEGHLMYGTRCLECEQCTGKEESFLDLSVPIPTEAFLGSVNCKFIPLEECIEHFAASEFLSGDNKYFCGECNHLSEAERFIKLSSLPPVLVLHINRFSHNSILHFIPKYRSHASSKLCNCIVIPEKFSLERWCMRKCPTKGNVYCLYAVVFHTGVSISSGHYTTAVLSSVCHPPDSLPPVRDQFVGDPMQLGRGEHTAKPSPFWYYFDDEKVSILEQKHFTKMLLSSSKTPYILFYCSQRP